MKQLLSIFVLALIANGNLWAQCDPTMPTVIIDNDTNYDMSYQCGDTSPPNYGDNMIESGQTVTCCTQKVYYQAYRYSTAAPIGFDALGDCDLLNCCGTRDKYTIRVRGDQQGTRKSTLCGYR